MTGLIRVYLVLFIFSQFISPSSAAEIQLKKEGSLYAVPVRINGVITLDFVLDSGASEVSIPADVFLTLIRAGTIDYADILPGERFVLADGTVIKGSRFNIRNLEIGECKAQNVPGLITPPTGSLLLGQSFLARFDSWTVDNQHQRLTLATAHRPDSPPNPQRQDSKPAEAIRQQPAQSAFLKATIPSLAAPNMECSSLLKEMIEGAKRAEPAKIEDAKSKLLASSNNSKCNVIDAARERNQLGLQATAKEDWPEAVKRFYEAYTLCPREAEFSNNLGFALIKTGDYDNAESALFSALAVAPGRANAWANLGQVLSIKGDIIAGCACFLNTFRYTRSEKRTTEVLQYMAQSDPSPNIQESARLALAKLGKSQGEESHKKP